MKKAEMQQLQLNKHLLLQQGVQQALNTKAQSEDADACVSYLQTRNWVWVVLVNLPRNSQYLWH